MDFFEDNNNETVQQQQPQQGVCNMCGANQTLYTRSGA